VCERVGDRAFIEQITTFEESLMSCKMIKAVAFDLDGLIFNTEEVFAGVLKGFLVERGREPSPEYLAAMIGKRAAESYPALKRLGNFDETPEELLEEMRRRFELVIDTAVHPMGGLFALLAHLEKLKIPKAVTTSSRREYAIRLLTHHRLMDHFTFILGSEDVIHGKPNPEIYRTAAKRFEIEVDELLVLEDSPTGLAAAIASGAFAVGVPHDHSPATGLEGASLIAARLDDPELFARLDAGR
jgi:HAD superfamily hydrolase (TIGR01509 family)